MKRFKQIARYGVLGGSGLAIVSSAHAADPTSLGGFMTAATGYITDGTTVAVAAWVLVFGTLAVAIIRSHLGAAKKKG